MILPTPLVITLHLQLKLQKEKKYSHKHFNSTFNSNTIFLQQTDKEEIANISSLHSSKSSGPNSMPY